MQQGIVCATKDDWLRRRTMGIGASDAPIILGLSKYKSPYQLYHEKLGLGQPNAESEAAEWGLALEAPIADRFSRETGRMVTSLPPYTVHQHEEREWMLATLDRWQSKPDVPTNLVPLELKTAHWMVGQEWGDEPPLAYVVQVQHQMAVTGAAWASIAALIGGQKFLWCDVARDDAFIEKMIESEESFWSRCIRHDPPPVDASDHTRDTLKWLYRNALTGAEATISLGPAAIDLDEQLEAARLDLKAAEQKKQGLENQLLALIGGAQMATLPNGVLYTYKTQTRQEHMVKASTFRMLRRKDMRA